MTPFQTMQPVPRVFVLPRCDVALYTTGDDDVVGSLVWSALQVENLRVSEKYEEDVRHYTGIPYPDTRHLGEQHELTFDAVWNVNARMQRNVEYILALTWRDASLSTAARSWIRRFYQGVTTSSRDIASRDGNEFGSGNVLKAKFYIETTGTGTPAEIVEGAVVD